MTVFENIDNEIARQKTSRRKVAIAAGIAPSTFQSLMERKRGMSFEKLQKIAAALNVSIDSLDPVTVAKKEATSILISKASADKKNGKEWNVSNWFDERKQQIETTAKKYSIDAQVLDKVMPTAESLFSFPNSDDLEMCSDASASQTFKFLPNDWRKELAVQMELDILKKYLGDDYSDKVFYALLNLFPAFDDCTKELALRLETLAYDPTEK